MAVAKIGTKEFASLDAAFKAAQPNDTVEMITNVVLSEKLTVTGFTGILDLGGYSITNDVAYTGGAKFLIDVVESDLTISNGTVFVTGNMVYARTNSVITIASDATINSEAGGGTPNTFRLYGDGATLNVYGTINKIGVEGGAIDQCVGSSIVNVYEGAKIKSNGYIFKVSVGAGNAPVVNVYGGELETTAGGYAAIYAYNNNTATINLLGGDFIIPLVDNKDGKVFSIAQPDKQTVTGLGADSAVRFSRKSNVADFCASGYSPKLADSWYTIAENPTVIAANVGNKGTLTVTGAGEKVAWGSTITGTLTEVAEGYVPFVFVDGVKVEVAQDGAFEGVANGSANVTVAYVNGDSWFTDPFMRNSSDSGASNENSQGGAIDEVAGKVFLGTSPGNSSAGIVQHSIQKLITGFGEPIAAEYAFSEGSTEAWGRTIAVAPKYGAVINGNYYTVGLLSIHPYDGPWAKGDANVSYTVPIEGLVDGDPSKFSPIAIDQDSKYLYGTDRESPGRIIVKFEIVADENDSSKIGKIVKVGQFDLGEMSNAGITVARIGGKDILYTADGTDSPIFIVDTTTGAIKKVQAKHNGTPWELSVGGIADGTPYLALATGKAIDIIPLTADGLDLAVAAPIYTVIPKDVLGVASDPNRIGFAITADGKNAFIAYGKVFNVAAGNHTAVATIEKKPANLIVRGQFVTDKTVDQPDDALVPFGTATNLTYTAPSGYQIDSVTVNGTAVAGFTAGTTYTFESAALDAYTLVKMTISKAPFIILIGSDGTEKARYADFDVAFAAAAAGDTVKLLQDVELEKALVINEKDVTFDLGAFDLALGANNLIVSNSTLVVTNGEIATTSGTIYFRAGSTATLAQEATISQNGTYLLKVEDATFNVYGSVLNTAGEVPAIHAAVDGGVINVYDGAIIRANGDAIRINGANACVTLNIYGGLLESTAGYQVIYGYKDGNTSKVNVQGGMLKSSNCIFEFKVDTITVDPLLTDACKAKFSTTAIGWSGNQGTIDNYCATGYASVKDGDWYVIAKVYDVTIAPTENGTVETSVTNGIVAGTEVTITATPATDYAVDTIAVTNGEEEVKVESNKFLMPAGNVTVYVTFKSTAAPGIIPGEEQDVAGTTPAEAQEAADKLPITLTAEQEQAGLKAEFLHNLVKPNAAGDGYVAYVEVKDELAPTLDTTTEDDPIEVGATDFSATIKNAQPGLYYGFKAVDALGTTATFEPVGTFRRATEAGTLSVTAPKGEGNARFYKLTVSITDLTPVTEN